MPDPDFISPSHRLRRLRHGPLMRHFVADVRVHPDHLVYPLFVRAGENLEKPVASMPGVSQLSPDRAAARIAELCSAGLSRFILFGVIDAKDKDARGTAAMHERNPVLQTLHRVRSAGTPALLIADLCFCEYTDHGHCGVLCNDPDQVVDNDATLPLLGEQACTLAAAGADIVAPSGMMDGGVRAVRSALDRAGHDQTAILGYSVKYASGFYGPFRDAGEGAPKHGDRRGYQMDYRRSREWKSELLADIAEGADMVMVKPAATYLDVIAGVRAATELPVGAYHVSGEYSMIHAAADRGWVDLKSAALEVTTSIRRAGADFILTYFAPDLLKWL